MWVELRGGLATNRISHSILEAIPVTVSSMNRSDWYRETANQKGRRSGSCDHMCTTYLSVVLFLCTEQCVCVWNLRGDGICSGGRREALDLEEKSKQGS